MSLLTGVRRALLGGAGIKYLLRATFDAPDQNYANGQVLDTIAEGIQDGQLTVVEVDGTLAIVGNKCAFTAQSTPVWGDLGFYSQARTRALGRGLLSTVNMEATDTEVLVGEWKDSQDVANTNRIYDFYLDPSARLYAVVKDGANPDNTLENPIVAAYSASTDYQLAIVLGGYDSNGVPWYQGQVAADYLYGASFFISGGTFSSWTLLWRTALDNTATLYAAFSNYDAAGTIELPSGVPDVDLSAVLQPMCLSTFTADNDTSLDAITPEVGGVWTEQAGDWDIQSNRGNNIDGTDLATVDSGIADCIADVVVRAQNNQAQTNGHVLRFSDTTHHWIVGLNPNGNTLAIQEVDAGITTRASTAFGNESGVDYDVRAICDAQQIDAFVDSGNKISYGSAALNETETEHGLRTGAETGVRFDNHHIAARTSSVYDQQFDRV